MGVGGRAGCPAGTDQHHQSQFPLEKVNGVFTEHLLYAVGAPADIDQVLDLSYLIWVDSCEVGAPFPFHR